MKTSSLTTLAAFLATTSAFPHDWNYGRYGKGGWKSGNYDNSTQGWGNITYRSLPDGWSSTKYGTPVGGWSSLIYPNNEKASFTSYYHVLATSDEVRNGTTSAPGPENAVGYFSFALNSDENKICYKITLQNVVGDYRSPAKTATHLHAAARGASGPPRIAFPNPAGADDPLDEKVRTSEGCITGPFTTGILAADGTDTGDGFEIKSIEDGPEGFYADSHTVLYPSGVVRGQLDGDWDGNDNDDSRKGKGKWNGRYKGLGSK